MLSVRRPQSVPSRMSVMLIEETEVRGAECLAFIPVDKAVRLLAGAACPASVTVCEDCVMMSGAVGMLSRLTLVPLALLAGVERCPHLTLTLLAMLARVGRCPVSDSVGPMGPDGTLSSSDLAGILFSAVPVGIPFPVGPVGTLSPSDSNSVGPVGPGGTLSSSVFAGILGKIDWERPGIHRGNLITCAGSERVTDQVCSIK